MFPFYPNPIGLRPPFFLRPWYLLTYFTVSLIFYCDTFFPFSVHYDGALARLQSIDTDHGHLLCHLCCLNACLSFGLGSFSAQTIVRRSSCLQFKWPYAWHGSLSKIAVADTGSFHNRTWERIGPQPNGWGTNGCGRIKVSSIENHTIQFNLSICPRSAVNNVGL